MASGIIFLCVCALVLVLAYFSYNLWRNIKAQKKIDELYAGSRRGRGFILKVLLAAFGNSKVMPNARIPVKGRNVPPAFADALIVSRSGITVISVMQNQGMLDNPQNGPWTYVDKNGRITTVENPFARNRYMTEVLKHILRKDGFHNISFNSLVVISCAASVQPKFTYRNMVTENTVIDEVRNIMLDKQLSYTEMRDVMMTVRRNIVKAPPSQNTLSDTATRF